MVVEVLPKIIKKREVDATDVKDDEQAVKNLGVALWGRKERDEAENVQESERNTGKKNAAWSIASVEITGTSRTQRTRLAVSPPSCAEATSLALVVLVSSRFFIFGYIPFAG